MRTLATIVTWLTLAAVALLAGCATKTQERTEDRYVTDVGVTIANVYETPEGQLYVRMHDHFGGERQEIPARDWATPWAIRTLMERLHKCSDLIDTAEGQE